MCLVTLAKSITGSIRNIQRSEYDDSGRVSSQSLTLLSNEKRYAKSETRKVSAHKRCEQVEPISA